MTESQSFGQTWIGGNGSWNDASNWDGNAVPSGDDHVYISNEGIVEIQSDDIVVLNGNCSLSLGQSEGSRGDIFVFGSLTTGTLNLGVGTLSNGLLYISDGGVVNVQNTVNIGGATNSYGSIEVDHGEFNVTGDLYIGREGRGELILNDGAEAKASSVYIGGQNGEMGEGSVVLNGNATWNIQSGLYIGHDGSGRLIINDDAIVSSHTISSGRGGGHSIIEINGKGILELADEGENNDLQNMDINIVGEGSWLSSYSSMSIKSSSIVMKGEGVLKNTGNFILDGSSLELRDYTKVYVGSMEINSDGKLWIQSEHAKILMNEHSSARIGGTTGAGTIVFEHSGTMNFENEVSGTGISVKHEGTGTTALLGENTYGAGTYLNNGTLIAGSYTALGYGDVLINGGTLKMSVESFGTSNIFLNDGFLAIANEQANTIRMSHHFYMTGGTYEIDILSLESFDQILNISGTGMLTLEGGILQLNGYDGFEGILEEGEGFRYHLFAYFDTLEEHGLTIQGYDSINWIADIDQEGYLYFSINTIPEPSAACFALISLTGAMVIRRRRQRAQQGRKPSIHVF